ncbi:acetoacetate decarboxylase family protein [Polyangium jinanense]|uniref:Acetoacetate decarboxylase family protein n=1 Tax=Polyangium jinanense TaxID=2829994 RepID=A0A9X3X296_9BACT|nr:acetoacetate decarboxylase family protein [Polyangium jinanense]MDC3956112.1 acetoacetate decarboxylase family protein [Polyangium jinanense]MDC3982857.1 acetoacetate decarboxylase family protein [Polyangium jinanense]
MSRANLPKYVERADNQAMPTPAALQNVTAYFFPLESDTQRQQALADKFLNAPSKGLASYRAFFPQVFLVFTHTGTVSSTVPVFRDQGSFNYTEAGIWIPLVSIDKTGPIPVATRLVLFPYYMFATSSHAVASGREDQGWPKEIAEITVPTRPSVADLFQIRPTLFDRFGPDVLAQREYLVQVNRVGGTSRGVVAQGFTEGKAALEALVDLVFGGPMITVPGLGLVLSMVDLLRTGPRFAFLKQFRDVSDPSRACYQAGIEAGTRIDCFRWAGLLDGRYTLDVKTADSHPMVSALGLTPRSFDAVRGFFVDMDFTLDTGVTRWKAF